PSRPRTAAGRCDHPVPGCIAERHRLRADLRGPVEQLRILADRRGPRGVGRRTGLRAGRPGAIAPDAQLRAAPRAAAGHLDRGLLQCPDARARRLGQHARRPGAVGDRLRAGLRGDLLRGLRPAHRRCGMNRPGLLAIATAALTLGACNPAPGPVQYGTNPELPEPRRGLLPEMAVADPAEWGDRLPVVPDGFEVRAIATGLLIPRQTLVLPNGDILVAEGRGGNAPALKPKDVIAGPIKAAGTTPVRSGNRLTLLRDADGDGDYELQSVFADKLDAPYGLALIGNSLYVANQDAVVRFDYRPGQTQASAATPETLTALPSEINHHWTKAMTASADGRFLYVGIGSNSNITERGMTAEQDRAMVWEIDVATGMHRQYATGLRNPTALAIQPGSGQLWAVVNERDEIGPDLVPDYLTSVREGGFYGWPWAYWGQNVDDRVRPRNPEKVAAS